MKQKILIRVAMTDSKTRAKAMQTAVQFKGVSGVELKGDHMNQIEVTGDEVDMIGLTNTLRKKVAFAELVSVNKVEPPKEDKKPDEKKPCDKKPDEKKPDEKKPEEKAPEPCYPPWFYGHGMPSSYPHPCDPYPHPCDPYPHPCDPYGYHGREYTGEPVYNHEPNCRIM